MILCVSGSPNFNEYLELQYEIESIIHKVPSIDSLVSGDNKGTERLVQIYGDTTEMPLKIFHTDWDRDGKQALFKRNERLIRSCDICLLFWDGKSKETEHLIELCKQLKKPYRIIYFKNKRKRK